MTAAQARLASQKITGSSLRSPAELVRWMGAVQAQDHLGSLWAVGLRLRKAVESDVEAALAEGSIIRTWMMRGTLHFVTADDFFWMRAFFGKRVIAKAASRHRQLGLDARTLSKSARILGRSLAGGARLDRHELAERLRKDGIDPGGQRLVHILFVASLDGLLCHSGRRGKQFTFALADDWVKAKTIGQREDAPAELARRYFTSHGPATLKDFAWWTGLPLRDAREGVLAAGDALREEEVEGKFFWSGRGMRKVPVESVSFLLPPFDEFLVGYQDRTDAVDPRHAKDVNGGGGLLNPVVVIDGQVVGTWRREIRKDHVVVETKPFAKWTADQKKKIAAAADRYGQFLGSPVRVS